MNRSGILGKIKAVLLSAVLMTGIFSVPSFADESMTVDIDAYAVKDGRLQIYLNHNQSFEFMPGKDGISVKFGAQEMNTDEILKFSDTGENVSYKCVVDVSGSMSQERIDQAKDMIKAIANKKKPDDNMAITALGNDLVQSDYMTDPTEIAEKADILTLTHDDTNLYYCVVEELKGMQTSPDVYDKKCLIIFSDGAEDQATGITREEAEKETEDSHIPIFTVALLKKGFNNADEESAKILGSFARLSSGGVHYAPDLGDGDIAGIPDEIVGKINNSLVLKESLQDIEVSGKEVVLKTTVTTDNGQSASDSINVPEGDVKLIQKEIERIEKENNPEPVEASTEEAPEKTTEESTEAVPAEKTIFGFPARTVYIIAGVLSALLIIVVIIIILTIKGRKEDEEDFGGEGDDQDGGTTMMGENDAGTTAGNDGSPTVGTPGMEGSPTVGVTSPQPGGYGMKVVLTRLGKGETGTYNANVSGSFTIGRSASKSKLAFPDDTALSGLHCTLLSKENHLYIKDNDSTNGTFVNGVPVSGQHELEQDDTILIGSYEYRISWK